MVTLARVIADGVIEDGVVAGEMFFGLDGFGDLTGTATIAGLLADWDRHVATLAGAATPAGRPLADCVFLPPTTPSQIFQVALNYGSHATEMGLGIPARPFVFLGLPSSLGGATDPLVLSPNSEQNDWELELAFVVKTDTYQVPPAEAGDHIAAYLMVNDVTSRDLLHRAGLGRLDYVPAKNAPGYLLAGPYLVSADSIDVADLRIRLAVNGETQQDASTADMIFDPGAILSAIASDVRLLAGDLVLTGTPAGVGHARGQYLHSGDVIDAEITGLGRQRTVCVARPGRIGDDEEASIS